jgi:Mannanase, galactose-binding domain-like
MKRWMGTTSLLILVGAWMASAGCRHLASPTFPSPFTPTPTATVAGTATWTPTHTVSPTVTNTRTVTSTATITPTPTVTATPTLTNTPGGPTDTPTLTATVTSTPTVTSSPTVTSTSTFAPCSASSLQATYPFDTTFDCWGLDSSSTPAVTALDLSTTAYSGTHSMHAAVSEGGTSTNVQFELNFSTPANMTGATITAWVYVDAGLTGAGAQLFTQSGSSWVWNSGGGVTPTAGTWTQVTWTPTWSNTGEDSTQLQRFGIQFYNMPTNATGNVYIDDVQISGATLPTPTATPVSSYSWYFETSTGNSIGTAANQSGNWCENGGGPVTGVLSWASPGYNSSAGCLNDLLTFTAQNQTESITYNPASPLNFTALSATGFRAEVWFDTSLDTDGYPGVQLSVESGSGYTWEQQSWTNLNKGAWTAVSFTPTWTGGNAADVEAIWVQVGTGGSGTGFGQGNIKLDNIELF